MHIELDFQAMTAQLVAEYLHPLIVQSFDMGSYQTLDNGNVLTGWGTFPGITEWTENGTIVLDIQTGPFSDGQRGISPVYLTFQMEWVDMPPRGPPIATDNATKKVYASWNGATEVTPWSLLSISLRSHVL